MNSRLQDGDIARIRPISTITSIKLISSFWRCAHYAELQVMLVVAISLAGGIGCLRWSFTLRRIKPAGRRPLNQLVTASQRIEHGQVRCPAAAGYQLTQ